MNWRQMRAALAIALLTCGVAVAAMACTPKFQKSWLVEDLRILAVRADPPEFLLASLEAGAATSARLSVLAVDPTRPSDSFDWDVQACTPDAIDCAEATYSEPVTSGHGPLDKLTFAFTPTKALLEQSLQNDQYRGFGGLPVLLDVIIYDGPLVISAQKRMVYTFPLPYSPIPPGKAANKNPEFLGVRVGEKIVTPNKAIDVKASTQVNVYPIVDSSAAEEYVTVSAEGLAKQTSQSALGVAHLKEALSYHYFTSAGDLSRAATGGEGSAFVTDKSVTDISSVWTSPDAESTSDLWIVVRDGRGGTDWLHLPVSVQSAQ